MLSTSPFSTKINDYVSTKDLTTLIVGEQLNDNIVNTCIDIFEKDESHVLYSRTYLLTKVFQLEENTTGSVKWIEHEHLPKKLKSVDGITKIYLPLLYCQHYSLYVVHLLGKKIYCYDSISSNNDYLSEIENFINYWMSTLSLVPILFEKVRATCPLQRGINNCGVYLILNLKYLQGQEEDNNQGIVEYEIEANNFRTVIKRWIVEGNLS